MVEHLEEVVFDDADGGGFGGVVFGAETVGGQAGGFVGADGLGEAFEEGGLVAGFEEGAIVEKAEHDGELGNG